MWKSYSSVKKKGENNNNKTKLETVLTETDLTEEIEECLNGDHRELRKLLSKVR